MNMDHKNNIAVDRISELPDHLQQHILSYLSINEVVQSSILSKRWKHAWTAVPVLKVRTTLFGSSEVKKNLDMQRKLREFYTFVEKTLERHCKQRTSIKKFSLIHCFDNLKSFSLVDRWINYVVKSDVKKLSLIFTPGYCSFDQEYYFEKYELPQSVLVANSITVLTLCWCKLDTYCGDINLSSLKKLSLTLVDADDKTIQKLVAGSPVIEDMKFNKCHRLKSINFSGLIKAKLIEVEVNNNLERVELESSNLYAVHIHQAKHCEINLLSCNNLRMLKLSAPNITGEWLHNHFSQLPLIEYLNIYDCPMLKRLEISSHRLKTFYLAHRRNLIEVFIDTPNLCKFAYCGRSVILFSTNALALSEVTYKMPDIAPWNVEEIGFLAKLSNSKLLTLTTNSAKDMVIPKRLRESLSSPSYKVKQLKVRTSLPRTGHEITELVDSLLWISPLPDILLIAYSVYKEPGKDTISFKFSYEKPILSGEKPSCCKLLPVPCWRHCLKSVIIENVRIAVDEETLKAEETSLEKYFYENTEILESFQFLAGVVA